MRVCYRITLDNDIWDMQITLNPFVMPKRLLSSISSGIFACQKFKFGFLLLNVLLLIASIYTVPFLCRTRGVYFCKHFLVSNWKCNVEHFLLDPLRQSGTHLCLTQWTRHWTESFHSKQIYQDSAEIWHKEIHTFTAHRHYQH